VQRNLAGAFNARLKKYRMVPVALITGLVAFAPSIAFGSTNPSCQNVAPTGPGMTCSANVGGTPVVQTFTPDGSDNVAVQLCTYGPRHAARLAERSLLATEVRDDNYVAPVQRWEFNLAAGEQCHTQVWTLGANKRIDAWAYVYQAGSSQPVRVGGWFDASRSGPLGDYRTASAARATKRPNAHRRLLHA